VTALKHFRVLPFLGTSLVVLALSHSVGATSVSAETLESALARAYSNSPLINATRAGVRATDENVPRALAGYRPQISATADVGRTWTQRSLLGQTTSSANTSAGIGLQLDQNLYDGNRTANSVRQAESQVLGARYQLDATVQETLFTAAQVYMNVLRDTAILNLQRNNVEVLDEQLRQTGDRFEVGEVTRTDVAQSEASLAASRSQVSLAEANLRANIAQYRRIIGAQPRQLGAGRAPDRLIPGSLDAAVAIALEENPSIAVARFNADAAELQVKIAEGALLPTLGVSASVNQRYDSNVTGAGGLAGSANTTSGQVIARLTVPLYQGGGASATVRQAKELATQRRFEVEQARDQVRFAVVAAWGALEAARAQITAAQVQVESAETALTGVREEARVGQRTTLDVLNAQQQLLNARVNLITAQRDRVVQSYAVVQAMGRLTPQRLALAAPIYDPKVHYDQVRGLLWGTSTPSGDR
jgi:outer membrane protein